ncbi:hypothetical protein ABT160_43685 [Streptomyces sp. NPDC001941]|uniref:hypothetical protein n=1 Tax=Streptomyces sp. NPDC001941 TaxID=3154659 RepID=UPI0033279FF3
MIRQLLRPVVALLGGALLLSGCAGADAAADKPPAHRVFSQKLNAQPIRALEVSKAAGTVSFRQVVTFGSSQGAVRLTSNGQLDFPRQRASFVRTWGFDGRYPVSQRESFAGDALGADHAAASQAVVMDRQLVHVRPVVAGYWLKYDRATIVQDGGQSIMDLRGKTAPYGETLLESVPGIESVTSKPTPGGGRAYTTRLDGQLLHRVVPHLTLALADLLDEQSLGARAAFTLVVDRTGRIVRVDADLTPLLTHKPGALSKVHSVRVALELSQYGAAYTPRPGLKGRILDAGQVVKGLHEVKPGSCVASDTGQGYWTQLVVVPCGWPHQGRIYAQREWSGTYPGEKELDRESIQACDDAYARVPSGWTAGSREPGKFWTHWPSEHAWRTDKRRKTTCYVLTR